MRGSSSSRMDVETSEALGLFESLHDDIRLAAEDLAVVSAKLDSRGSP